jgi:hypothetical protein
VQGIALERSSHSLKTFIASARTPLTDADRRAADLHDDDAVPDSDLQRQPSFQDMDLDKL